MAANQFTRTHFETFPFPSKKWDPAALFSCVPYKGDWEKQFSAAKGRVGFPLGGAWGLV